MKISVVVEVSLRPGISDPESVTIMRSLPALGFHGVEEVRSGRIFHLVVESESPDEALKEAEKMATRLLSNPVIEQTAVRLVETE
jgi:phosphoribosylformylglycinamidine synthase subunit PurS